MSIVHCDQHVPSHINSAVTSSQTLTGDEIQLYACTGVTIQTACTNGAAGTVYVDITNQQGTSPAWVQTTSATVAANGTALLNFSQVDQLTSMHKMRCRFTSTAAGNVQVSVNGRRLTY